MEETFRKDLGHTTWDTVYARQVRRAALVTAWLDGLGLAPGDHVLDVGSGPGYVSLRVAERVGPQGLVYAVDRSAAALAYLERLQGEQGLPQIRRICADAAAVLLPAPVRAALVTMVLHHTDDPAGLLRHVAGQVAPGGGLVVAEFHPDGPCTSGPPGAHRVAPEQVQAWCTAAGLTVRSYVRQTPEHFMLTLERT